jgi:hypothetical protein
MKRVIVDYKNLPMKSSFVKRFPDDDSNIVRFRNAKNELIEAVEVRTADTIYLVKVSMKLADQLRTMMKMKRSMMLSNNHSDESKRYGR